MEDSATAFRRQNAGALERAIKYSDAEW